jgi:hypothetical protein
VLPRSIPSAARQSRGDALARAGSSEEHWAKERTAVPFRYGRPTFNYVAEPEPLRGREGRLLGEIVQVAVR